LFDGGYLYILSTVIFQHGIVGILYGIYLADEIGRVGLEVWSRGIGWRR